jgi:glycosyltransferase involved in cell wall biosynthesis
VSDDEVLIVHVTHFNNVMWDNNQVRSKVIEHGVKIDSDAKYTGEIEKGIVVINNLTKRGRRLGLDIYEKVSDVIPLDLIGLNSKGVIGGIGEIPPNQISQFVGKYRFLFNPIRYTSLGLAVCEAMMVGVPVIGLATTEMVRVIKNNHNGYLDTNIENLMNQMEKLLSNHELANEWSLNAKETANEKFNIDRFKNNWMETFHEVISH